MTDQNKELEKEQNDVQEEIQNESSADQDMTQEEPEEKAASAEEAATEEAKDTASEADEAVEDEETDADGKESKLFKKSKKADKKNDKLQEKVTELEDKVKRQMAEFDNFRKRTEKEKSAMFETGARSVIEKILPIVDNFERGLATIPEEEKGTPFVEGMNMVYRQLLTELEKLDVKPIEAVGKEFNPDFHNAAMQVESEEYESGIVAQELLKGYTYRDTVIRHSVVAVVS